MGEPTNYRLTLKFSEKDPNQVSAYDFLKTQGRRKSAFITKAVLFYLEHVGSDEECAKKLVGDKEYLKALVKEILVEMKVSANIEPSDDSIPVNVIETESKKETISIKPNSSDMIADEGIDSIQAMIDKAMNSDDIQSMLAGLDVFDE